VKGMSELVKLAQQTREDVKAIEQHPSFKPYLGFKAKIVSSPSQGGNIRQPKKINVTGTK
jgi:hypothetical protein